MAINFLLSKIASYPSRTVLFENFFCVVAVLYLVYNLESWVPYLDIIKGIWGEKLFAATATPPSCHIQSPKKKRAMINFASYLLAMLQKNNFCSRRSTYLSNIRGKNLKFIPDLHDSSVNVVLYWSLLAWNMNFLNDWHDFKNFSLFWVKNVAFYESIWMNYKVKSL